MRNRVSGVVYRRWIDGEYGMVRPLRGLDIFMPEWKAARYACSRKKRRERNRQSNHAFYHLPDGTTVTLEMLVLYIPLHNLFQYNWLEFDIEEIRLFVYAECQALLSYKQVRDALYRISHGKVLFRHIQRGKYTWLQKDS